MPEEITTPAKGAETTQTGADNTGDDKATTETPNEQGALTFSRDAFNDRIARARESAVKSLLAELGVESADAIKAAVDKGRQAEEAGKTELEKAATRIQQLEAKLAQAEKLLSDTVEQRNRDRVNAAVVQKAREAGATDPQDVVLWLRAEGASGLEGALDDAGEVDAAIIDKAIKDCQAKKPHYFQTPGAGKGSPSNSRGKVPEPNSDVKQEIRRELRRQVRF